MDGGDKHEESGPSPRSFLVTVLRQGLARRLYYGRTQDLSQRGAYLWLDQVDRPFQIGQGVEVRIFAEDVESFRARSIEVAARVTRVEPASGRAAADGRQGIGVTFEHPIELAPGSD